MAEEWMTDETRRPYVMNSLASRRNDLRLAADRCRKAFNKDFMGVPSRWLADTYDRAADILDEAIAAFPPQERTPE